MKIRVSLKGADRSTQRRSETERDFLTERIGPLGKPRQRPHASQ